MKKIIVPLYYFNLNPKEERLIPEEKKCVKCGEIKEIRARGLCKACYAEEWRNSSMPFKRCGNEKCGKLTRTLVGEVCTQCFNGGHRVTHVYTKKSTSPAPIS